MWQGEDFPLELCWIKFGGERKKRERKKKEEKKEEEKRSEKFHLLSRIHRDRTVGFCRSKRKSPSTRKELHVGTRIWGFRQTPRGRGFFPTFVIFGLKAIQWNGVF